jgi:hypothetical protein
MVLGTKCLGNIILLYQNILESYSKAIFCFNNNLKSHIFYICILLSG